MFFPVLKSHGIILKPFQIFIGGFQTWQVRDFLTYEVKSISCISELVHAEALGVEQGTKHAK